MLETGDPATSLGQLLSWSYRQLSPAAAQIFALLGVHCGPDITVPAAASLAGVLRAEAGRALAELAGASLAAEHRPGRYVLHDLVAVRRRARPAGPGRGRDPGGARAQPGSLPAHLAILYVFGVIRTITVAPPVPGVLPERLAGDAATQDWLQAEHQVLLQATVQAAAAGLG